MRLGGNIYILKREMRRSDFLLNVSNPTLRKRREGWGTRLAFGGTPSPYLSPKVFERKKIGSDFGLDRLKEKTRRIAGSFSFLADLILAGVSRVFGVGDY